MLEKYGLRSSSYLTFGPVFEDKPIEEGAFRLCCGALWPEQARHWRPCGAIMARLDGDLIYVADAQGARNYSIQRSRRLASCLREITPSSAIPK
ncbi:hypothetical protein C1D09_007420 [Mesorhizobium intechi]|uniref:hypothetical protein n=1 Tax=Mesorhizobium intechi TaxID=537601 RepID=UPI000CC6DBE9|nr:hypothetical protein [Mesorhizobium intechi]TSE12710.1 hypothetical protein C1D09_007420 [Mesorhizobium intechi]